MSKVNKNSQFGTKSWFYGSKNDDKVPKSHVGRRDFRTILAYIRPFLGTCAHQEWLLVFQWFTFDGLWPSLQKELGRKVKKGQFWWILKIFLKNVQTRLSRNVLLLKILGTQLEIPPTVLKISPQIFLEVFTISTGYNRMKPDFWLSKFFRPPKVAKKWSKKWSENHYN